MKNQNRIALVLATFFLIGILFTIPSWWTLFTNCLPPTMAFSFPDRMIPDSLLEPEPPKSDLKPIPKLIHLSTPRIEAHYHSVNLWRELNQDYEVILYNDTDMNNFIATEYPEFLDLYNSLYHIVERADLWRYLIIHSKGGFYSDIDWVPKIPIESWQSHMESGIEHDFEGPVLVMLGQEDFGTTYPCQFIQWGFGGSQGHPLFYETAQYINEQFVDELLAPSIPDPKRSSTYRTGPEIFTRNVYRYLQRIGADISAINRSTTFRYMEVLVGTMKAFRGTLALHENQGMGGWKKVNFTKAQIELRQKYWGGTAPPL